MLSQSMQRVVDQSSAIRAMFEEGRRMAARYGAENVFDFSLGNPSQPPPAAIAQAIIDAAGEDPMLLHGYMPNAGYPDTRKKIADSLNRRYGTDYGTDNIVMTVGAAGAINIALKTILDPGDEVLVFAPFFGEYRWYVENYQGKLVAVPPLGDGFSLDVQAAARALGPRTKAAIINTPNNPSGAVYGEGAIRALADVLLGHKKKTGQTVYLISDEPYREIVYDGITAPYVASFYSHTFTAYSFSKSLSLPGQRIGYLAAPSCMDGYEAIWPALAAANRILGFVNSPSLFQRVAGMCADLTVDISTYRENRDILHGGLTQMGYECAKPGGAFYLFPRSPIADDALFCEMAKEHRILIVPGRAFGSPGRFRIAYCVKKETAQGALDGFRQLLERAVRKP